jgi:hypothetical protein
MNNPPIFFYATKIHSVTYTGSKQLGAYLKHTNIKIIL